jgi:hypothetical protein
MKAITVEFFEGDESMREGIIVPLDEGAPLTFDDDAVAKVARDAITEVVRQTYGEVTLNESRNFNQLVFQYAGSSGKKKQPAIACKAVASCSVIAPLTHDAGLALVATADAFAVADLLDDAVEAAEIGDDKAVLDGYPPLDHEVRHPATGQVVMRTSDHRAARRYARRLAKRFISTPEQHEEFEARVRDIIDGILETK